VPYLTPCPWQARSTVTFHQRLPTRLDLQLADAIALAVSHENSCRFCYATVRVLLRIQGMSEARVQALTRTDDADILITEAVRERLDLAFALSPRPAARIKDIAEPMVAFAVA
jgi:AhpD family alkylhydroperoxidase